MGGFCLVVDAPCVVLTPTNKIDHNLCNVYQIDAQLCLNYPDERTVQSGEVSRGRVCHQRGYPV